MALWYSDEYTALYRTTPPVIQKPGIVHGRIRKKCVRFASAAAMTTGEFVRLFRVKANDSICSLKIGCSAAWTGNTAAQLGIYRINDGAVLDADIFGLGLNLAITFLADTLGDFRPGGGGAAANGGRPISQAGFTIRELYEAVIGPWPNGVDEVDIALTFTTDPSAVVNVGAELEYVSGD